MVINEVLTADPLGTNKKEGSPRSTARNPLFILDPTFIPWYNKYCQRLLRSVYSVVRIRGRRLTESFQLSFNTR